MPETQTALTLQTLLAVYPNTAALRNGEAAIAAGEFRFCRRENRQQSLQGPRARAEIRPERACHRHLSASEGLRQAVCSDACRYCRARPASHHLLQSGARPSESTAISMAARSVSAHTHRPPAPGSEASCRKITASISGAFSGSPLKIRTSPSLPIRLGCGARRKGSS